MLTDHKSHLSSPFMALIHFVLVDDFHYDFVEGAMINAHPYLTIFFTHKVY